MSDNRYTVCAVINPDQPDLFYLIFDTLDEAMNFFETLKGGMTAHCISVELHDPAGKCIERVQLGDEVHPPIPREKMAYRPLIKPIDYGSKSTGSTDSLLID